MLSGVNIDEVRNYNKKLKAMQEEASRATNKVEIYENELKANCEELSKLFGFEVTVDNVEQVYNDYMKKVRSSLESGNTILNKINEEMSGVSQTVKVQTPVQPVNQSIQQSYQQTAQQSPVFATQMPSMDGTQAMQQNTQQNVQQTSYIPGMQSSAIPGMPDSSLNQQNEQSIPNINLMGGMAGTSPVQL